MKILFIAPVPPPVNGQSKAAKVLLDALVLENVVQVVDLSKTGLKSNDSSVSRLKDMVRVMRNVHKHNKNNDLIYLSLAESFAGNMRDLAIYNIIKKDLSKTYIHMLGGAGMKEILTKSGWQKKANANIMKKLAGVIVEGQVNYNMFKAVMPEEKIHIVPNFAEDFLFVSDEEIKHKFSNTDPLELLYLSNLIPGKGYNELADAYLLLNEEEKSKLKISFVGGFESLESEHEFMQKIKDEKGIKYLGKFVDGKEKRNLYCKSHVFCLPTYYPYEGQPISILEAYATGCVVITSNHSGIPYVFKDAENGVMVEKKSVSSLVAALQKVISEKESLEAIAFYNRNTAVEKYRTNIYQEKILKIFDNEV